MSKFRALSCALNLSSPQRLDSCNTIILGTSRVFHKLYKNANNSTLEVRTCKMVMDNIIWGFHKLDVIGNNANIGIFVFTA